MSAQSDTYRLKELVTCPVVKSDGRRRPYIGLEDVGSGTGELAVGELQEKAALDSVLHAPGDVLFSKLRPYLAKSFLASRAAGATGELLVLRPKDSIDQRFLLYLTLSSPWLEWAQATSYGSKMPRTSWEAMADYRIDLPMLDEQRRIADFLDERVGRLEELRKASLSQIELVKSARLEGLRRQTVGEALPGRSTTVEWMPRIAKSWTLFKIGRTFRTGSGTTPSSSEPRYFQGSIAWINTGDLRDSIIDSATKFVSDEALRDYPALRLHPPGSLVIAMYGATIGRVGIISARACVNQACCVLLPSRLLSVEYVFYWLLAHRGEIVKLASGGGQPNISQDLIKSLHVPAPCSLEGQAPILAACRELSDQAVMQAARLARRVALLAERRQALITAAITGQIDVTTARGVDV